MKITEYPSTTELAATDVLLLDGTSGTRKIAASDLPYAIMDNCGVQMHRMVFRGKNLGSTISTEHKTAIQNGTFKDLWIGDYWEINSVKWRIVDFDYWYNKGNPKFTTHHLVIMPDTGIGNAKMNDTSITTGGYTGSLMYTTNMADAKSAVTTAFGSSVLTHKEYLINTVTSGYPSAGSYVDSSIELPNEPMIFGSYMYTPANDGATDVKRYTISNTQLALFTVCPEFILSGNGYWLRDVASGTHFACVDGYGGCTSTGAANAYDIRPVFPIGG